MVLFYCTTSPPLHGHYRATYAIEPMRLPTLSIPRPTRLVRYLEVWVVEDVMFIYNEHNRYSVINHIPKIIL